MMPKCVTAVIVTWNKRDAVLNLLTSLYSSDYQGLNIVVVDNASSDGTAGAIRNHPLHVTLLENSGNLGGTGGFDAGIRYAIRNFAQDYMWLLDNDAEVTPETLKKLVEAMEHDESIGIAGSCILNPADKSFIVEAGGFIDFKRLTWKPNLRYELYARHGDKKLADVDYVPACSALVRREVFDKIGMLDVRCFLHWDDVDFCYRARLSQFKIKAVLASRVYHEAEKGYSPEGLYYDVRNSLLFAGKHLDGLRLAFPLLHVLFRASTAAMLLRMQGERLTSWVLMGAIKDFAAGRFGRIGQPPNGLKAEHRNGNLAVSCPGSCKNILIFAVGGFEEIQSCIKLLSETYPSRNITLAIPEERAGAYSSNVLIGKYFLYNLAGESFVRRFRNAVRILFGNYDCAVSAGVHFLVPYAFLVRKHFVFDHSKNNFRQTSVSWRSIWKVPASVFLGAVLSLRYLSSSLERCRLERASVAPALDVRLSAERGRK